MMKAIDLDYQSFARWATLEPRRGVRIEITDEVATAMVGEWVGHEYVCQIVTTVAEIDLAGKFARQQEAAREHRRAEYERLAAEFEGQA